MREIMGKLREGVNYLGGKKITGFEDYKNGFHNLPKSDVVRFLLEDNCSVVVRPSGTEPKIKFYFGAKGSDADAKIEVLRSQFVK